MQRDLIKFTWFYHHSRFNKRFLLVANFEWVKNDFKSADIVVPPNHILYLKVHLISGVTKINWSEIRKFCNLFKLRKDWNIYRVGISKNNLFIFFTVRCETIGISLVIYLKLQCHFITFKSVFHIKCVVKLSYIAVKLK